MFAQIKSGVVRNTLALGVSILIHGAMPAHAADVANELAGKTETISRAVSTAGLNLAEPSDQAILRQRIAGVSRRLCHDLMLDADEDIAGANLDDCIQSAEARGWASAEVKIAAAERRSIVASVKP
jgi:UrcA family protein